MRNEYQEAQSGGSVRPFASWRRLAAHGACAGLLIAFGLILFQHWYDARVRSEALGLRAAVAPELKVLQDDWNERITRESYWRSGRSSGAPPSQRGRSQLQGPPPSPSWYVPGPSSNSWFAQPQSNQPFWTVPADEQPISRRARSAGGYRTVCVRACDGFFFPVSFGASEASFSRDQATCTNTCPGSRLYYYKSSSDDPEDMVDLTGQPYSKLKNANLFRTQYVESCKCKPHPWEQEATERHRIYALEAQRRKGNRAVVAELEDLKTKASVEKAASRRQSQEKRKRKAIDEEARLVVPSQSQSSKPAIPAPRSDASRGQGGDRTAAAAARAQPSTPSVASATSAASAPTQAAQAGGRVATGSAQAGGTVPTAVSSPVASPDMSTASANAGASTGDAAVLAPMPTSIRPGSSATSAVRAVTMPASPAETAVPQVAEPLPAVEPQPGKRRKSREARHPRQPSQPAPVQRTRSADWVARTFNMNP